MSKLNIALIGAGRRGAGAHLPVIAKLKDVYNLVAICDIDKEAATRYAKEYGATPYTNVRDLVAHTKNLMLLTLLFQVSPITQSVVSWQMRGCIFSVKHP